MRLLYYLSSYAVLIILLLLLSNQVQAQNTIRVFPGESTYQLRADGKDTITIVFELRDIQGQPVKEQKVTAAVALTT